MSKFMKQRYSAPESKFIYRGDEKSEEPGRSSDSDGHRRSVGHYLPLGRYLADVIQPGDLVLDVGCGSKPLGVVAANVLGARTDVSKLKIIGVDLIDERKMPASGRNFCYVRADLNSLDSHTVLDPAQARAECRLALSKVQKFLEGQNPAAKKADVLVAGGILHYVGLGEPFDALLSMVKPDGKVVVSGVPDYDGPHKSGRNMDDLAQYLAEDGKVQDHCLTGFVLSEAGMKLTGQKALDEALRKHKKKVSLDSWIRHVRDLVEDPEDARGVYGVMPVATVTRNDALSVTKFSQFGVSIFHMMPMRVMDGEYAGKCLVGEQEVFTVQLSPDTKPKKKGSLWGRLFGR